VYATVARVNSLPFQYFSTFLTKDLVTTKLDKETGIAEISMHNGAVNSLSLEMYVDTVVCVQTICAIRCSCR
jgi:hypothetical protein